MNDDHDVGQTHEPLTRVVPEMHWQAPATSSKFLAALQESQTAAVPDNTQVAQYNEAGHVEQTAVEVR